MRVAVAAIQLQGMPPEIVPLHLPLQWVEGKRQAHGLQQVMDQHVNEVFGTLLARRPELVAELAWVGDKTTRKAAAMLRLYDTRPSLRTELAHWRSRHLHLWRYRRGIEVNLRNQQRDIYRVFVAKLVNRCATCGMEDLDIERMGSQRSDQGRCDRRGALAAAHGFGIDAQGNVEEQDSGD